MFFYGYTDSRRMSSCDLCNSLYPVSKPWQRFCSDRCNWTYQYRYGQKGRTRRLKRLFKIGIVGNKMIGSVNESDLAIVEINGQLRIRSAVRLEECIVS